MDNITWSDKLERARAWYGGLLAEAVQWYTDPTDAAIEWIVTCLCDADDYIYDTDQCTADAFIKDIIHDGYHSIDHGSVHFFGRKSLNTACLFDDPFVWLARSTDHQAATNAVLAEIMSDRREGDVSSISEVIRLAMINTTRMLFHVTVDYVQREKSLWL